MAGLQKLDFAELPLFVEFLDVKKLAGIDHRFHHDVFLFRLLDEVHDFFAVLNTRGHRHGAGDVFAGLERGDGLPGMIGNRRVDVNGLNLRVLQQLVEIVVASLHSEGIPDGVELFAGALADGVHVGVGMPLVNGDKLRAKAQPDYGDVDLALTHASLIRVTATDCKTPQV